jgi:Na+-translocating ferredoxin:NAD+ oxidoreductase RnfG subunit
MDNTRQNKFYPVILLTIVIVMATAFMITTEKISRAALESQQDPATLALLQQIFPDAGFYSYSVDTEIYTIYDNNHKEIGYAFYGEGLGYTGKIVVLVGLEDKETIKNIIVISQYETAEYFKRLTTFHFFDQFIDLKVENCIPVYSWQDKDGVDVTSGATYSSIGVINAVQSAALEKIPYLD